MALEFQSNVLAAEIATTVPAIAAGGFGWQLANLSSTLSPPKRYVGLVRLEIELLTAVSSDMALVFALTNGTQNVPLSGEVTSILIDSPVGKVATAWTVAPTISGAPKYMRSFVFPATVGTKEVWDWPEDDPLVMVPEFAGRDSILLQNLGGGASGSFRVSARWLEINFV